MYQVFKKMLCLLVLFGALTLTGCGQMGPLTLPAHTTHPS
jgi:predicted small lipoprotein YifL